MKEDQRYDVVIYNADDCKIESMAGENMPLARGSFHTAEKRLSTVLPRLNEDYTADIVPTGKYKKGMKLSREDIV